MVQELTTRVYCWIQFRFGRRTVDALKNSTGILGYTVAFQVDAKGGIGLSEPDDNIFTPSTQEQQTISIPSDGLKDGDTVVIWLFVADATGGSHETKLTVGVDRTRPVVASDTFRLKTVDDYTTRFIDCVYQHNSLASKFITWTPAGSP